MRPAAYLLPLALLGVGCAAPSPEEDDAAVDEAAVTGKLAVPAEALAFHTSLAADASACPTACDVDRDGLNDAWEDAVLARFQPRLELDEQEKGRDDPSFRVGVAGRVVARAGDPSRVVVFFGFAWSEDYGACGFTDHHGDVERAVLELARVDGTTGDLVIVKAYTASHEGDPTDKSHTYAGETELRAELEFLPENGSHRWLLYTSRDKHGTFASKGACESRKIPCLADYCGADGVDDKSELRLLPALLNVGEPAHPRESNWAKLGYPSTDAWTSKSFCGAKSGGDCDSAPRTSFTRDPFSKKDI